MVKVRLLRPRHPTYLNLTSRPRAWKSSTRKQTILITRPWKLKRSYPFETVGSVLAVPSHTLRTSLTPSPRPPDDAFAAKHMPDLGYDVKEFQVFHWKLQGWKKLEKKLTGPEFDCGGHKWYVFPGYPPPLHLRNLKTRLGEYFSFPSEIPTLLQMIPSPFTSITPTPKA